MKRMIRVTVELWPGGSNARAREIARMNIGSISDRAQAVDYEIWASSDTHAPTGQPAFEASGKVVKHKRNDSIWALLTKATAWVAASAKK
jgi:hypothetical protein